MVLSHRPISFGIQHRELKWKSSKMWHGLFRYNIFFILLLSCLQFSFFLQRTISSGSWYRLVARRTTTSVSLEVSHCESPGSCTDCGHHEDCSISEIVNTGGMLNSGGRSATIGGELLNAVNPAKAQSLLIKIRQVVQRACYLITTDCVTASTIYIAFGRPLKLRRKM